MYIHVYIDLFIFDCKTYNSYLKLDFSRILFNFLISSCSHNVMHASLVQLICYYNSSSFNWFTFITEAGFFCEPFLLWESSRHFTWISSHNRYSHRKRERNVVAGYFKSNAFTIRNWKVIAINVETRYFDISEPFFCK